MVEPARITFPDGAHTPGNLTVALPYFAARRQRYFLHKRMHIFPFVHASYSFVMHIENSIPDGGDLCLDQLRADNRRMVAVQNRFGLQIQ